MNIRELPYNAPNGYNEVAVGDILIMNSGANISFEKDHIHIYEITYKDKRYAKVNMTLKKCIFEGKDWHNCQNKLEKDWSWFINYADKIRWLRTPAQKILFGINR